MPLSFNHFPYFSDYDPSKDFYDVLVRPGYALQAREINTLQSILEEQIRRFGNHIFQDGSMVIPGQIAYDTNLAYVKIDPTFSSNPIAWDLIDPKSETNQGATVTLRGATTGITATVVLVNSDVNAIYVQYIDSGTNHSTSTFQDGETINLLPSNTGVATAISTNATGKTAFASIQEGIYFIFGRFLAVHPQTVLVDNFNQYPSARVGLEAIETIVTPEDDLSLNDNAAGTPNYAAPGAHRYKVELALTVKQINATDDENFVELLRVQAGIVQKLVDKTFYSEIMKTLARRTNDAMAALP